MTQNRKKDTKTTIAEQTTKGNHTWLLFHYYFGNGQFWFNFLKFGHKSRYK